MSSCRVKDGRVQARDNAKPYRTATTYHHEIFPSSTTDLAVAKDSAVIPGCAHIMRTIAKRHGSQAPKIHVSNVSILLFKIRLSR